MSQPLHSKPRYRTNNWKQYNATFDTRGSLTICLNKACHGLPLATANPGHGLKLSDAAIQLCLAIQNLLGLSLRKSTGFVQPLPPVPGLPWPIPDFSTLCSRQRSRAVSPQLGWTNLLRDSTDIKFPGDGEWKCKSMALNVGINAQALKKGTSLLTIAAIKSSDLLMTPSVRAGLQTSSSGQIPP